MELLRSRDKVPYVKSFPDDPAAGERLVILPAEDTASTSRGRPTGPAYYDISEKLAFMDAHGIDISVISLANPWLDWLPPEGAADIARNINDDMERTCAEHEGRLYAFGTLPLSAPVEEVVQEVERLANLRHMRGIIMGTSGLGSGLDDPDLNPIYAALEMHEQLVVSMWSDSQAPVVTDRSSGFFTLTTAFPLPSMDLEQVIMATYFHWL